MAPGARNKLRVPMFELAVFRKQMHYTEVLMTLLGLFGARELCPLTPVVTPLITALSDMPQIMVHSSNQRHMRTLGFRGENFQFVRILLHFEKNE